MIPGTHRGKHPKNVIQDAISPHADEEYIVAPSGSVAVFNSHIWHGDLTKQKVKEE